MRINDNFLMRDIAGEKIVVPVGEASKLNAMITMNRAAAFMWECLQEDISVEELRDKVLENFEVDEETVKRDVDAFIAALCQLEMLEE